MNPKIMLIVWTIVCSAALVSLVVIILRFIKKNKMKKNILVILAFCSFLVSCQKEISTAPDDKYSIVEKIGFNLKTTSFVNTNNVSQIAPLNFESVEKAKEYFKPILEQLKIKPDFKKIISQNKLLSDSVKIPYSPLLNVAQPVDTTVTLQEVVVWTGYSATITIHVGGNSSGGGIYSVIPGSYSSGLIGLHPGVSWTANPGGSYVNYPNSALIYFTVTGWQNYNIIVQGLGTIYSEPVTLQGVYNMNTHAYTLHALAP